MSPTAVDRYLADLGRELRRHGLVESRIVEETREHLVDAIDAAQRRGLPVAAAEREALDRFGPPASIAATFATRRGRAGNAAVLAAGLAIGAAIAYVDAQPTWDDAGITAFALLGCAGVLGLVAPRRPWLWALSVGIWIPAHAIAKAPGPRSVAMLVILAFPLAGAYAGMFVRKFLAMAH
jgi:hypothetical protein